MEKSGITYSWHDFYSWIDGDEKSPRTDTKPPLITGVAVDSRFVLPGCVFFALRGAKTDGHFFLEEVAKKGASCAVVACDYTGPSFGMELIVVQDPLITLQNIAKKRLQKLSCKVIGVTGSVGKTSTKSFIYDLLKTKWRVSCSSENKNSQIGLALVLLNEVRGDEDFLVLEMAMSEKGHIQKLVEIAPPSFAVITSIALVHAENFASIEDIARAKAEIFSQKKTEYVLVNYDTECADLLLELCSCKKETYSLDLLAETNWKMKVSDQALDVIEGRQQMEFPFIRLPAEHMYQNLLGAIALCYRLGMTHEELKSAFSTLKTQERRLEEVTKNGVLFINDAYNAATISMKGALLSVKKRAVPGKKIAVLGHMKELGKFADLCHRQVGECALESVDLLFAFGEGCSEYVKVWQEQKRDVRWHLDYEDMMSELRKEVQKGDLVLVKGARSLKLERVIESY